MHSALVSGRLLDGHHSSFKLWITLLQRLSQLPFRPPRLRTPPFGGSTLPTCSKQQAGQQHALHSSTVYQATVHSGNVYRNGIVC